ncbi:hypothetical protein FC83_GL002871 [Agrilactobacillus composti DSM 18527 = JCM 14202]|uniref:Heavy-metal chelation domain-containing protein n=1 Tax=Agrilactobacillus composti DSM 18527 = JCM 14202 TaxID=1423734 RepID=X0PFJ9_9LACO|nr:DUF364 domain-containing protein [Agrilactobacillus composti]KRM33304.1 hypothetical protein FC83_GL002871 [Agrilactobacillus composti DSM 18527 = JCM 14202]GAF40724.1 molybdenum transport ATP-binding protein ModC [Agrilactobacillus composti DSM 18527 = JCM 14202]
MWQIYDELIAQIPTGLRVQQIGHRQRRLYLKSDTGVGTAMLFQPWDTDLTPWVGQDLKTVAAEIKSWDFQRASIGLAAINSYLNQADLRQDARLNVLGQHDVFADYQDQPAKVATIGHFYYVDKYPKLAQRLTVFELNPRPGDYPASATEFLLPEMNAVLITGSTLVNKTLPRLLELAQQAEVVLVGGSTPLAASLLDHGISKLAGVVYQDLPKEVDQPRDHGTPLVVGLAADRT